MRNISHTINFLFAIPIQPTPFCTHYIGVELSIENKKKQLCTFIVGVCFGGHVELVNQAIVLSRYLAISYIICRQVPIVAPQKSQFSVPCGRSANQRWAYCAARETGQAHISYFDHETQGSSHVINTPVDGRTELVVRGG